jgi:transketolase
MTIRAANLCKDDPTMDINLLEWKSIQYRKHLLEVVKRAGAGHMGGDLSCIDILNVLYNAVMNISPDRADDPDRDRYVQSKGHAVEALYVVLADRGFFSRSELESLGRYRSRFIGHPTRDVPGIEHNTGALGHGLAVAIGMALAAKKDGRNYRVFTLLGDGELAEGSVWEASLAAAHYGLDNLVVIVDRNTLQITGRTEDVMALEPLHDKFSAFGYEVRVADGNDITALVETLGGAPFVARRPSLILARTVKGCGVSFMQDAAGWHHHVPDETQYAAAMHELDLAECRWRERYAVVAHE